MSHVVSHPRASIDASTDSEAVLDACSSLTSRRAGLLPRSADAGESFRFHVVVIVVGVVGTPTPPASSTPPLLAPPTPYFIIIFKKK